MKKYLFIVLLLGVWSCEDEQPLLIGEWKYSDYEINNDVNSGGFYLSNDWFELEWVINGLDSIHEDRIEKNLKYIFTNDSLFQTTNISQNGFFFNNPDTVLKVKYFTRNDTIFTSNDYVKFSLDEKLTLFKDINIFSYEGNNYEFQTNLHFTKLSN